MTQIRIIKYCLFLLFFTRAINSAPRNKQPSTTYDQKQTGEYNIQLHLKDFQIIAVVGEDSFGSLTGDYDYNYDYNDFTIKPTGSSSTTVKPDNTSQLLPTSNTTKVNSTNTHVAPHAQQTHHFAHKISSTAPNNTTVATTSATKTTSSITSSSTNFSEPLSSSTTESQPSFAALSNLSQIPVIVQEVPILNEKIVQSDKLNKKVDAITNVEIISNDNQGANRHHLPLGEIFHYQKCSHGFTRDKTGRCRKLRRQPQMPLGFTRFANNLAAKFKTGNTEESLVEA